eukprot:6199182-Heterocapsa_arctica.AAC.1
MWMLTVDAHKSCGCSQVMGMLTSHGDARSGSSPCRHSASQSRASLSGAVTTAWAMSMRLPVYQ